MIEIEQFACLSDNYGYLIHDPETGHTAAIDTPEVEPILAALKNRNWQLTHILNTHHHYDHAGGNLELKDKTGCTIYGPKGESAKIPGIDIAVDQDDSFIFGKDRVQVLNVGGHTLGHIAYYIPECHVAFVGDALFALGCGRMFEGTAEQMWGSLSKLAALPPQTEIFCAHEYTLSNAKFAVTIDPENQALQTRAREIEAARAAGQPTVPTTIALELVTNPFLRAHDQKIRAQLSMQDASDVDVFAEIRARKDNF